MSIILARVDDRLIHGQVTQAWLPTSGAEAVVVVTQAQLPPQAAMLMRLSLPGNYALHYGAPAEMAAYLKTSAKKNFVLIYSLKEALELVNLGAELTSLNIGGIHYAAGKSEVCPNFFLSEEEKTILKALAVRGVEVDCRAVPKDRQTTIMEKI